MLLGRIHLCRFDLKLCPICDSPVALFPLPFGQLFPLDDLSHWTRDAEMTNSLDNRAALLPCFPVAGLHRIISPMKPRCNALRNSTVLLQSSCYNRVIYLRKIGLSATVSR
jgi:hypothetical protein